MGELKTSHYHFGFHPNNFSSTTKVAYKENKDMRGIAAILAAEGKKSQQDQKSRMRSHHFEIGTDQSHFQTMNHASYKPQTAKVG
jgi:hypothetical protein